VITNIKRYDSQSGNWETASWFMGDPAGVDFTIKAGAAYLVYLTQDLNDLRFEGPVHGAALDLAAGLNLVSLPMANHAFEYRSYDMLQDLGDESQVYSIRRYDVTQGWQTTSWFLGSPSGADYITSRGEGYMIYMKEDVVNWRPY
jgi:hypothetical protein